MDRQVINMGVPMQEASIDIWDTKYRLKNQQGEPIDIGIEDSYRRVAKFLSKDEKDSAKWYTAFIWAMANGAIPAGRIMSNAGAEEFKPATSLINCVCAPPITDSIKGILMDSIGTTSLSLKAGCGIGMEGSTIRPKGAVVNGAGATTTGSIPFLKTIDMACMTIASAGGRRGAMMLTFDLKHPDVLELIKAKRVQGALSQFNISLLITDEFIEAVKNDEEWVFSFPVTKKEYECFSTLDKDELLWRKFDGDCSNYKVGISENMVACRVYGSIPAKELWDIIMQSTYEFSEPGFLLIDKINKENTLWFAENIRSTNPCAEQPLPPNGACLLGSINLTKFVVNPFGGIAKNGEIVDGAYFDWNKYIQVIRIFTRLLDNVVDYANLPLPEQQAEIERKRRHGMGYLGLGSAHVMLGIEYGSEESIVFTGKVTKLLALEGWKVGVELAKEKGCAPIFNGDEIKRSLFCKSHYMQKIFKELPVLKEEILNWGCRFTHHSSIAPTGTISLSLANNASNGIEPSFMHHYVRNVIKEGKATKETMEVNSYELLVWKQMFPKATIENLPFIFKTAGDFTPKQHIDVQAAAQYWIDSSISKTINVATDIPFEEFKDIYWYAIEKGLKGCTTYRHNPEVRQGVLMSKEEQASQTFNFVLEDGSEFNVAGDAEIEYEGEVHNAANLYDGLKGGTYGSY